MVGRRKSSLVLFLCLQAMAVAIICLGSLINFHQYKIWGKPLIPNFVGYKRDIEKYAKTLSLSKHTNSHQSLQNYFSGSDCEFQIANKGYSKGTGITVIFDLSPRFAVQNRVSSSGLRGPPIS
jgi:hypothetical protein